MPACIRTVDPEDLLTTDLGMLFVVPQARVVGYGFSDAPRDRAQTKPTNISTGLEPN